MKNILEKINQFFDIHRVQHIAYALNALEKRSSYDDFDASTRFCMETMRQCGLENIERIAHAADGKTTVFDYTMPQAWSLDREKRSFIEIVGDTLPGIGSVLADSSVNPLHANIWSSPTPDGGITAELIDFADLTPGNYDVAKGKWVLYAPQSAVLIGGVYHDLAEAGIAGMVGSDFEEFDASPDSFEWQRLLRLVSDCRRETFSDLFGFAAGGRCPAEKTGSRFAHTAWGNVFQSL